MHTHVYRFIQTTEIYRLYGYIAIQVYRDRKIRDIILRDIDFICIDVQKRMVTPQIHTFSVPLAEIPVKPVSLQNSFFAHCMF